MIHSMPFPDLLLSQGGDHGGLELVRRRLGHFGPTQIQHIGRYGLSQCDDHPHERGGPLQGFDRIRPGLQHRNRRHRAPALSPEWDGRVDSREAIRTRVAGGTGVSRCLAKGYQDTAAGLGLRLQRLVPGSLERAHAQGNRHRLQRRSTGADHETGRFLVPAPQAHDERQARRSGVSKRWSEVARAQKRRSARMPTLR